MKNIAADLLHERMQRAFDENPRGELYRTLTREKLLTMLKQNIAEIELAFEHDNDVEDKLADAGNYVAFLLRNHVDPPQIKKADMTKDIIQRLQGRVLDAREAQRIVEQVILRVRDNAEYQTFREGLTKLLLPAPEQVTTKMRIIDRPTILEQPVGWGKIGVEDDRTP